MEKYEGYPQKKGGKQIIYISALVLATFLNGAVFGQNKIKKSSGMEIPQELLGTPINKEKTNGISSTQKENEVKKEKPTEDMNEDEKKMLELENAVNNIKNEIVKLHPGYTAKDKAEANKAIKGYKTIVEYEFDKLKKKHPLSTHKQVQKWIEIYVKIKKKFEEGEGVKGKVINGLIEFNYEVEAVDLNKPENESTSKEILDF